MKRGAPSTGFLVFVALAALLAGACGSSDPDPEAGGTTSPAAGEVEFPRFGPFDTGVLSDISLDSGASEPRTEHVVIQLRACEHVAPGRWLFRGDVSSAPDKPTAIVVRVSFDHGDMSEGVGMRATVTGRGPFTLPIDLFAGYRMQRTGFWAADSGTCRLELGGGAGSYADVTASNVAIDYRAPAGTVQALGIGARMDRRDAKFEWAYFAWSRRASPFAELWIPPLAPGRFWLGDTAGDSSDGGSRDCVVFSYSIGDTNVRQSAGCRRLTGLTGDPVPGAHGYHWQYETADRKNRSAVLARAEFQVTVSDGNLERMEAVAASLRPFRSVVVDPHAQAPSLSFAEVVAAGRLRLKSSEDEFGPIGELHERARIQHDGMTTIAYAGHYAHACSNCEDGLVAFLDVYKSNGRWRFDIESSGSFDDCLSISAGWGQGSGVSVRAVTADARWTIGVLDLDTWGPVHIVKGVWVQNYPTMPLGYYLPRVVVRNAQGKVVPCRESATP